MLKKYSKQWIKQKCMRRVILPCASFMKREIWGSAVVFTDFIADGVQYLYDLCMVRTPEIQISAAADRWGLAFFEYIFQVPANRIGSNYFSAAQLKIIQEVITLTVFAVFSVLYLKEEFKWNYLLAFLCMVAAVFFVFKK